MLSTQTHTQTYVYIYSYSHMCVCFCLYIHSCLTADANIFNFTQLIILAKYHDRNTMNTSWDRFVQIKPVLQHGYSLMLEINKGINEYVQICKHISCSINQRYLLISTFNLWQLTFSRFVLNLI